MLFADLGPGDGEGRFLAGLECGEAVLEVLGSLDHGSVQLYIDEDCSQPPTLGHEKNLLARTKLIELVAKLFSQVICGNHTWNCHIKPIVDPTVNRRVVRTRRHYLDRRIGLPDTVARFVTETPANRYRLI